MFDSGLGWSQLVSLCWGWGGGGKCHFCTTAAMSRTLGINTRSVLLNLQWVGTSLGSWASVDPLEFTADLLYSCVLGLQDKWAIVEPPVLAFAHTNNPKYNWDVLTTSHFQQ